MKIGIYGGSFNPIHFGHLGLARWIIEQGYVDELWLMVTPNNPLKDSSILADEKLRLEAAKVAVKEAGLSGVVVSDWEIHLPRPNYTAQTFRSIQEERKDDELVLIIGEDNWQVMDKWREWEWILTHFSVLVYPRHGSSSERWTPPINGVKGVKYLEKAPYFDVSSTQLREKARKTE